MCVAEVALLVKAKSKCGERGQLVLRQLDVRIEPLFSCKDIA
jgi:hypothetical protein